MAPKKVSLALASRATQIYQRCCTTLPNLLVRYISILNNLTIPRKYHFEATVLPDGRVLLSGPPNVWTTRVLSAPSLRRQMCRFRLQDGTNNSFLMARHHHVACLSALVVIPQSSVTGLLFLALISLVFESIRKRYSCFEIWCPCQKSTGLR